LRLEVVVKHVFLLESAGACRPARQDPQGPWRLGPMGQSNQ
jgi:hypothetical protein